MGIISNEIITEIRERADIVQLIGEHVRLIPSGHNYKALCPFHKEKTPSFNVVPGKQIFHCFGCGKGGDVFTFIMELEHITFPEAVKYLAMRVGVELPTEKKSYKRKTEVFKMLDQAARFYEQNLFDQKLGKVARDYLCKRHISLDTARKFRLGFSLDLWDSLVQKFGTTPENLQILKRAGLIRPRSNGNGFYDIFRNRLMIPIVDNHGRIAGFGGRVVAGNEEPKYLNSPETETFNKRKMLFNFREALPAMRNLNSVIVVEGYLDAISLSQHGITNVVATLGTSITPDQIHMLARNCERVFFCYDADAAGQKATFRAISLQKDTPINARMISFPDPKDDPDSFICREGAENFKKLLEESEDIYTFIIKTHTRGLKPPFEIQLKEKLVQEFKEFISAIHSPIARSEVIRKISKLLDMEPLTLEKLFAGREVAKTRDGQKKRPVVSPKLNASIKRQEWVLKHLLEHPEDLERVRAILSPEDFTDPSLKKLFEAISFQQQLANGELKPAEIMAALDEPELISRLSELITALEEQPVEPFMECVKGLLKSRLENEIKTLQAKIKDLEKKGDERQLALLSMEQIEIKRKIDLLY